MFGRIVAVLILGGVLLSGAAQTLMPLLGEAKKALEFSSLSWSRRRESQFGPYYRSVREIRERLPENAEVAIVMADVPDREPGIFASSYLYPRSTLLYWGPSNFRQHVYEGAVQTRRRPTIVIWFDRKATPEAQMMTAREFATR
jgi:hypothetical protein